MSDEARRCAKCGQPFGRLTTSLTTCESCFDEAQANADEARRQVEECVTEVLNRLDADGMNWGQALDDGVRAVERLVADAVARAVKEKDEEIARLREALQVSAVSAEIEKAQAARVDREHITTLEQAIREHTCSSTAAWCSRCNHFHVSPHGLPLLCEALRREPQPAQPPPGPPGSHALQFLPGREPEKMPCSFCGKVVDPEGHRWECSGREPAGDAGTGGRG